MSDITRNEMNEIIKRIDENVHEIKIQTTKTNGNVRALQLWRSKVNGALVVLSIVMTGIIIPLVLKYLSISLFK
jgi:hypothetical protein